MDLAHIWHGASDHQGTVLAQVMSFQPSEAQKLLQGRHDILGSRMSETQVYSGVSVMLINSELVTELFIYDVVHTLWDRQKCNRCQI